MASATSELAQKLARRRAGEQVFETVAKQSSANAVAEYVGGVRMEGGRETVFESMAATSVADASCTSKQAEGSPSSQQQASEAFAVALKRIRAFEQAQDAARSRSTSSFSQRLSANRSQCEERDSDLVGGKPSSEPASDSLSPKDDVVQRERQVDFKSAVRDRFLALLKEGLSPNEAAARAIREAAGQPTDAKVGLGDCSVQVSDQSCVSSEPHRDALSTERSAISVAA